MKTNKKTYISPDTVVCMVEIEGPICSTSVNVANPDDTQLGQIKEQTVQGKDEFSSDAFAGGAWTEVK